MVSAVSGYSPVVRAVSGESCGECCQWLVLW